MKWDFLGAFPTLCEDFGRKSAIDDSVKDKVQRRVGAPLAFSLLLWRTSISACKQEKLGSHRDVGGEKEAEDRRLLRPRTSFPF